MPADQKNKIVIIGATSAIAEHCARHWVEQERVASFSLVGRDAEKLDQVAADLQVRSGTTVEIEKYVIDFSSPLAIQSFADDIFSKGRIDIVLVAHGALPEQEHCQQYLTACEAALFINGTSPVLFAEAFAGHMEKIKYGTLAVIGSVAGDRGRKSNYVYGAAKGLVTRYVQGLQHRLAGTGVKVVLIKPGPTQTPMTAHLPQQANFARVDSVAAEIVKGISKEKSVIYAPAKWGVIMMVVRHLPAFVFNRMEI